MTANAAPTSAPRPVTAAPSRLRRARQVGTDTARAHSGLVWLLAFSAIARVLTMIAFQPALFFNDSWGYAFTAFTGHPVSLSYLRPNGYPILMHFLTLPGRSLTRLVALQHLAGLLTGTLVYAALDRAGIKRGIALAAAALVLLDGYRLTLEQYLMPEAFFTLTLLLAALIIVWPRLGTPVDAARRLRPTHATVAGLLLAAATIQREAALFAAPAFLAYLVWARVGYRALATFLVALALPVLGYAAVYEARLGVFGLTETSGWTLYGRVAAFANCAGAGIPRAERRLCETAAQRASHPDSPTYYIWDSASPAGRLFHGGHQTRQVQARADGVLGDFADRIIRSQPLDYLDASISDAVRYFAPGAIPFNDGLSATSLPAAAGREPVYQRVKRRVLPNLRLRVQSPAGLIRTYRSDLHLPRPLLALIALASLAAVALRLPASREITLLSGAGLLIIIATAATAGFGFRYLLPTVPLLAIGGGLAVGDLMVRVSAHRRRSRGG